MRVLGPVLIVLALASCGSTGRLAWPDGEPAAAPLGAEESKSAEAMLKPPPQAKPERLDDPVERSEERGEDEFDLPPTR